MKIMLKVQHLPGIFYLLKLFHLSKLLLIEEPLPNILQLISTLHCLLIASYDTAKLTFKTSPSVHDSGLNIPVKNKRGIRGT